MPNDSPEHLIFRWIGLFLVISAIVKTFLRLSHLYIIIQISDSIQFPITFLLKIAVVIDWRFKTKCFQNLMICNHLFLVTKRKIYSEVCNSSLGLLRKMIFLMGIPLRISACQIICAPNGLSSPKKPLGQNLRKLGSCNRSTVASRRRARGARCRLKKFVSAKNSVSSMLRGAPLWWTKSQKKKISRKKVCSEFSPIWDISMSSAISRFFFSSEMSLSV